MAKVVFIEPAQSKVNFFSRFRMPLLGPVYLGTILKNRGHQVRIYNENFYRPDYSRLDADLIGISILTSTAKRGYEIARMFPKGKVIFGGMHASLFPEEPLRFCRQVVAGEGEGVIADVVEGRAASPVIRGDPVGDLDALPFPDFSLVEGLPRSMPVLPVSTSRGCPFDCSFCSVTRVFGRKYRFRSPESIIDELKGAIRREIFFCDDNFCADRNRLIKLMRMLSSLKRKFSWTCQARCEAGRDEELLALMKSAGCSVVCLGLESINDKTLENYNKRQNVEEIASAVRAFHRHKIRVHGMFVLGGEYDDEKTAQETIDFAVSNSIDTVQISALTPFPGTRVDEELSSKNAILSRDWDLYDGQHVVFAPARLTARRLQHGIMEAYAGFYSLRSAFALFLRFRLRNAVFRLIGRAVLKEWHKNNRGFPWLRRRDHGS